MPCKHCQEIRTAILHGRMAEAAGLTVEKLRESIGWKSPDAEAPAEVDELADGGAIDAGEGAFVGETTGESIVPAKDSKAK